MGAAGHTSEPVVSYGASNMVTAQTGIRARNFSITILTCKPLSNAQTTALLWPKAATDNIIYGLLFSNFNIIYADRKAGNKTN
jgi:uncharacterized membrane protein YdjX (TVP38/TMEM64 family)